MTTLPFNQYKAAKRLQQLSQNPFDLTLPENLTPKRLDTFSVSGCGYTLLYGTERVNEEVMSGLFDLAQEAQALQKMRKMQSGEVINCIQGYPSENRAVLHTATRDFFEHPQSGKEAKKASQLAFQEIQKLREFIEKVDRENRFTDLILIGIGGSELGPKAHYLALQYLLKKGRRVHFVANIDPDELALTLRQVNLAKCLILVVSKTGTTLETQSNEEIVREKLKEAHLSPNQHMVSITMPGSPLDDLSQYRACFYIWDWIGGRYSTTSMVGAVLLAFAYGFDVFWEFLKGANAMDKHALNQEMRTNIALIAALLGIWNRNFLNYPALAIIPYSQALSRYPAHIQQLDMESNGKSIDKQGKAIGFNTGPIIWGEPGTNSQHSFFQLLHQGSTVVPVEFIAFGESQIKEKLHSKEATSQQKLLANVLAQMLALATGAKNENPNKIFSGNRPSHLLLGKQLTPFSLGALLSFYEHKVAFQGFIWNINSFDQEGVQLGKKVANAIIKRFADPSSAPYPLADTLIKKLEGA